MEGQRLEQPGGRVGPQVGVGGDEDGHRQRSPAGQRHQQPRPPLGRRRPRHVRRHRQPGHAIHVLPRRGQAQRDGRDSPEQKRLTPRRQDAKQRRLFLRFAFFASWRELFFPGVFAGGASVSQHAHRRREHGQRFEVDLRGVLDRVAVDGQQRPRRRAGRGDEQDVEHAEQLRRAPRRQAHLEDLGRRGRVGVVGQRRGGGIAQEDGRVEQLHQRGVFRRGVGVGEPGQVAGANGRGERLPGAEVDRLVEVDGQVADGRVAQDEG